MSIGCSIDADCPEGYLCFGGHCVPDIIYIEPPVDPPLPGLGYFLRKRYTSNVAITEEINAIDLLHEVIFPSSRMFLAQSEYGKISIKNKKPAPYAYGTAAFAKFSTTIDVDNVSPWINTADKIILIAPHTSRSEVRGVSTAAYATNQNSITCSNTGGLLTTPNFSGYSAPTTPATSTITVTGATAGTAVTVTIDGVQFDFTTGSADTTETIAAYIAGVIAAHPSLSRRFTVAYATGASTLTLTARTGRITLAQQLNASTSAPLANPVTAPTLSGSGTSTTFTAGQYAVAYSAVNANGETLLSEYKVVTLTATQKITVSGITLPSGATSLRWYCSPTADSNKLRLVAENTGGTFDITELPRLSASLPPDTNRTGAEVMDIKAVFSDRADSIRSISASSNVMKASFTWVLGNREKPVNRVDLKYRDATQDYRLVELRLRDETHIDKTKKISKHEVNGQAIDNTDQAYRIAAGLLAEKRDADFFYQWKGTRTALLLQEGDVVAITDDGSGVVNLPVIIEQINFDIPTGALPEGAFTARKYSSSLYDDSIVDRVIPVVSEN
jgi:hypothetical protein